MEIKADVEVFFEFVGFRKEKIFEGYRPAHQVKEDYLTTGVHNYYNLDNNSGNKIKGTITFVSPYKYPACMWVGKIINMYEGNRLVGYATVIKILNPILEVEVHYN